MKLISKKYFIILVFSNYFSFIDFVVPINFTHAQTITVISVDGASVFWVYCCTNFFNAITVLLTTIILWTIYKVYLSDKSGTSYIATGELFNPGVSYSNVAFGLLL
jgi:hypothetical protein